jgi:DUF971 family protein
MHGSLVRIGTAQGGLRIETHDDRYRTLSVLRRDKGELVLDSQNFRVYDRGKGIGAELIHNQVTDAAKAGVKKITVDAIGDFANQDHHNGYYTWPRLGFDGELPGNWKERMQANGLDVGKLPDKLQNARRVSDFFKLKDGRNLWKRFGFGLPLEFDLSAGSRSRQVLSSYYSSPKRGRKTLAAQYQQAVGNGE